MLSARVASRVILVVAWLFIPSSAVAETLGQALRNGNAPIARFSRGELASRIAGYASSASAATFLLAYDDGSKRGSPEPTLHVLRFDRNDGSLVRATFVRSPNLRAALMRGPTSFDCLGSAVRVAERSGRIYLETHVTPSAGCVVVLTTHLRVVTALSGWILGYVGDRYAVVRESERHVGAHSAQLAVSVYDGVSNASTPVYPVMGDRHARGAGLAAPIAVNANAVAFSLTTLPENASATKTDYVFALFTDRWESRAFADDRVRKTLHVRDIDDFVRDQPRSAF